MRRYSKALVVILALALPAALWMSYAQPMDESSTVVKENEMIEAALEGQLREETLELEEVAAEPVAAETPAVPAGPAEAELEVPLAVEEVPAEAPVSPEAAPAEPLEKTVTELLGESSAGEAAPAEELPAAGESAPAWEAPVAVERPLEEEVAEILGPGAVRPAAGEGVPASAVDAALQEAASELQAARLTTLGAEESGALPKLRKEAPAGAGREVRQLEDLEETRKRAFEQHAMELLAQAEAALRSAKHSAARKLFDGARKQFAEAGFRPQTQAARDRIKQGDMQSAYGQAQDFLRQEDYAAAEQTAKEAAFMGHPEAAALLKQIEKAKVKPAPPPEAPPARWDSEDFKQKTRKTADMLKAGREFYEVGEYAQAQRAFEAVLQDDPQNTEAIRWREKTAQQKYRTVTEEVESTRADMMTEVRRTWNKPDYGLALGKREPIVPVETVARVSPEDLQRRKILDKMKDIVIPEVDFRQANINDVVEFLQEASVQFDPSEEGKKGVNIILNLRAGGGAPAAAPVGEFGVAEPVAGMFDVPQVTFKARDISLLEVLKTVTDVSGLKYWVRGTVVMIVPLDAPPGEIIHRSYGVLPTIGERIGAISQEMGRTETSADFRTLGGSTIEADHTDWKEFFRQLGVDWPAGSSIKYIPALGQIMVANTAENLAVFEERLNRLNQVVPQVEIEARFVEVKQMDLSSLGFEWLLTDDWEIAHKKTDAGLPLGAAERIVMRANSGTALTRGGFTAGTRFATDGLAATLPGLSPDITLGIVNDSVLSVAGVLTNPELAMVLHALQQKGNADLLSAPKVVTQSGQQATIRVVTEYIYPTEFNVEPILSEIEGRMVPVGGIVEPASFETREVGVLLEVMPTVTEDREMINLTLAPEVVTEPTWRDYGSTYRSADGSEMVLPMPQPFFPVRRIETSIMIHKGATLVMGGMINEARNTFDDKVPLLGDIPLVGRLFRSKGEQSEKRNLLIFVTAGLIRPDGSPEI